MGDSSFLFNGSKRAGGDFLLIYEFIVRDSDYDRLLILQKTADSMQLTENKIVEYIEEEKIAHEELPISVDPKFYPPSS